MVYVQSVYTCVIVCMFSHNFLVFQVYDGIWGIMVSFFYSDFFFFQAEDGIRYDLVTGVQTCALPIWCMRAALRFPREMVDRQLVHLEAQAASLDHELRRKRSAARMHRHALPDLPPEQLEGAVDVPSGVAKQRVDQQLPAQGIELAHRWVGAVSPPSNDE